MKKLISKLLILSMTTISLLSGTSVVSAEAYDGSLLKSPYKNDNSDYIYDCVWLGQYPQSEVTSEALLAELEQIEHDDGEYISYAGNVYASLLVENESGKEEHFYVCEPLKWRVLNAENGKLRLISDKILDCYEYERVYTLQEIYKYGYYDKNWKSREVAVWLNGEFFDKAFNEKEQGSIGYDYTIIDSDLPIGNTSYLEAVHVNLLTSTEACMRRYGFADKGNVDNAKCSKATDYVKTKGVYDDQWMCKNEFKCIHMGTLATVGICDNGEQEYNYSGGIRPVITTGINTETVRYAGTVCTDGSIEEKDIELNYISAPDYEENIFELQDVQVILKTALNIITLEESGLGMEVDFNKNGVLDLTDANVALKIALGIIRPF